ncbi:hypothetical protein J1605_010400, partial [Eschrichtius robustus]
SWNSPLGRGLFPPPSRNCPGARGEGDLTEAAGSGGAPAAEAVTVAGTAGRKERPPASGPRELRSLLSPLPSAWLARPGGRGEGVGLSVLRGNGAREAQGPAAASAPLLPTAGKAAENSSRGAQAPYSAKSLCAPSSLS